MPDKIENILAQIVYAFNGVTGIDAIVLGGSRATDTAVSLLQVLYAINGMYMLNEKSSLGRLLKQKEAFIPKNSVNDVEAALSGLSKNTIQDCFDRIQAQYNEIFSYSR